MADKATIILHSGDMDKVFSALIIGNGALAMGMEVAALSESLQIHIILQAELKLNHVMIVATVDWGGFGSKSHTVQATTSFPPPVAERRRIP